MIRKGYIALFLLFCTTVVQAQKKDALRALLPQYPLTVFKSNPFATIWGAVPFTSEYRFLNEFVIGKYSSVEMGLSYLSKGPFLSAIEDNISHPQSGAEVNFKVSGFHAQAAYKFYLTKFAVKRNDFRDYAPHGYYYGLRASFAQAHFTNKYYKQQNAFIRGIHSNVTLMIGRQTFFTEKLSWDVFFLAGTKANSWILFDTPNNTRVDVSDELPRFISGRVKMSIGMNFGIALD